MSEHKRFKRDHPVATALNFGEYAAVRQLLDRHVPLPPADSVDDSVPTSDSGRLRLFLMKCCRDEGIGVRLSATPRLPSFPKHPGVFRTLVQEREYNRVYRQVWEQRQEIIENSPDYRERQERARLLLQQERDRRELHRSESDSSGDSVPGDDGGSEVTCHDQETPTIPTPDGGTQDMGSATECWCSDPLDPEVHGIHS